MAGQVTKVHWRVTTAETVQHAALLPKRRVAGWPSNDSAQQCVVEEVNQDC